MKSLLSPPRIRAKLTALATACLLTQTHHAATYIKPDESKDLFKLENIPLQVDSIKELAKHLVVIARRSQDDSPQQRRCTAQLLALAIRLDPTNQDAHNTNRTLANGNHPEPSPDSSILTAKSQLHLLNNWLASPDAGNSANLLSNYLTDATRILHPGTIQNKDIANWTGVIPILEEYNTPETSPENTPKPNAEKKPETTHQENNPANTPNKPSPPIPSSKFHITPLSIRTPLILQNRQKYRDPKNRNEKYRTVTTHAISTVTVTLRPCKPKQKGRIHIKHIAKGQYPPKPDPIKTKVQNTLLKLLASRHNGLPETQTIVEISGGNYARANQQALTSLIALMLESSLHGTPLKTNLHLCALVSENGEFTPSKNFWTMLKTLRKSSTGGRLLIPASTAETLSQILVYGEPDFFTRWEIITVKSLDDALTAAAQKSPDDLAKASQLFESIQNLAQKTDVTKLAANHTVRSRLSKILELAPNHLSARVLLLQGSGKRPMRLNEKTLALEILPIVQNMHHAINGKIDIDSLNPAPIKKTYEETRASLASLASVNRIIDHKQNDLHQAILNHTNDFRRLLTIIKRMKGGDSFNPNQMQKARALYHKMRNENHTLLTRTLLAAGFPAR